MDELKKNNNKRYCFFGIFAGLAMIIIAGIIFFIEKGLKTSDIIQLITGILIFILSIIGYYKYK
jgi:hypothetical protein